MRWWKFPLVWLALVLLGPVAGGESLAPLAQFGDRDTKQIKINLPPSKPGMLAEREDIRRITGRKNEMVILAGYGSGHGVGLSLCGAKAMAEKAINPGSDYYMTILKHYYQGVTFDKWY